MTMPIGEISTLNSPPEYNSVDLTNIINDINQTLGVNIRFTQKDWVSPRGNTYNLVEFTIQSNNDPLNWIELLMRFSGLSIKTVTYDINNSSWTYKGEIYELQSEN